VVLDGAVCVYRCGMEVSNYPEPADLQAVEQGARQLCSLALQRRIVFGISISPGSRFALRGCNGKTKKV